MTQQHSNIRIEVLYPFTGHPICYHDELELLAELYSGNKVISLDDDLSAKILVDGSQISHLFAGSLSSRLPSNLVNRSFTIEVSVVSGNGMVLNKQEVSVSMVQTIIHLHAISRMVFVYRNIIV